MFALILEHNRRVLTRNSKVKVRKDDDFFPSKYNVCFELRTKPRCFDMNFEDFDLNFEGKPQMTIFPSKENVCT